MTTQDLGERLQAVRKRRGLTQRELANLSGVSLSLIRKLEQHERPDTRLETLRKLASALRVQTTALIVRDDADNAEPGTVDQWRSVRDALRGKLKGDAIEEAATPEGVEDATRAAMPMYFRDRYSDLGSVLPRLIRDADTLNSEGRTARAKLLHLTGWLLTQTRQFDDADIALSRAQDDALDRLDAAAIVNTRCFLLIRQGKLQQTLDLAGRWADDIEPRMSRATRSELSAWGWLLIRMSTSAVRNNQPGDAEDAIRLAMSAAVRMGREYAPSSDFLRTFGPITVAMKRAENAMIEDRPDRVLSLAENISSKGFQPTSSSNRNRHRLDVAKANVGLRHYPEAFDILQEIRRDAPEWIVNQRLARDVLGTVFARRRTLTADMREMAEFMRLAY